MSTKTEPSSEGQASGLQSGGQSGGGGRKKGKLEDIPVKIHGIKRTLDDRVGLGVFHLEMPYDPKTTRFKKDTYPPHFLDVKDDDQMEILGIMKKLTHPNILEVSLINLVSGEGVRAYVEPYSGVLSKLLKEMPLLNPNTNLIPSEPFQDIVSEVVDVLKYLIENDQYHGNFDWATTYYLKDSTKITTKIANLARKGSKPLKECQAADCVSLGLGLAEITEYAKRVDGVPDSCCCLIEDLSRVLISVTAETVATIMDGIKGRVFFWDERRRTSFLAVDVPLAWDLQTFVTSFIQSDSMPVMPWTNQHYDGYLAAMEAYRAEIGIGQFNKYDWKDFLRCLSGMYTHKKELDVARHTKPVDSSVLKTHPRIFLDLKAAMDPPVEPPIDQPEEPQVPVA